MVAILPIFFLFYLWNKEALNDFLFSFPLAYRYIHKYAHQSFAEFAMLSFDNRLFIVLAQRYLFILIYITAAGIALYSYIKKVLERNQMLIILFLVLSGFSFLPYAYFKDCTMHIFPVIYPALILSGFILEKGFSVTYDFSKKFKYFTKGLSFLILLLLTILLIDNTEMWLKYVYKYPSTKETILLKTSRGNVYVWAEEIAEIRELIEFIDENTLPHEKIFLGFHSHKEIAEGNEPMIYFLADRLPPSKYFVLMPGLFVQEKIQKEIIDSLNNVNLIILTSKFKIIYNKFKGEIGSSILDDFIRNNYILIKKIGSYDIYFKKSFFSNPHETKIPHRLSAGDFC